ncbi:PAS domain-containing hybrid sensor histidine kinase/response regulator [Sporobolomyces koalae]|uniref:PAS domain-containing hybrid sensor histidine kinase/response regulator n=1 Tax=Sporobolomyces koalae TaxID=500713 RepID=UPI00317763DA
MHDVMSESLHSELSPALLDYLDDQPLPACVFSHCSLFAATSPYDALIPTYQNTALEMILAESTVNHAKRTNGREEVNGDRHHDMGETSQPREYLRDAMDEQTQAELIEWLGEGVRLKTASQSQDATTASETLSTHRPKRWRAQPRSVRDRALKLVNEISFSKLYWRATHIGSETHGFTVLSQLPVGHLATRGSFAGEQEHLRTNPVSTAMVDLRKSSPKSRIGSPTHMLEPGRVMVGVHEVDAEKVKDPNSLEGMAYTLFHAPIGIFRVNTDLSITSANPTWRNTCGVAEGDSTDSWPSRIYSEDRARVIDHYAEITRKLPMKRDEFEFRWEREGAKTWASCVITPAVIDGRMEGYCGFLGNISKHKDAATAAQRREEQLQSELAVLSESATVGLARIDPDGKIITVNKAWMSITHLTEDEDLDNWQNFVDPSDYDRVIEYWSHALKSRQPLSIKFRWKSGEIVLGQVQPNHSKREYVSGFIGTLLNVTAESKAEDAVLNLLKEREASAVKAAEDAEKRRQVAVAEKHSQELLIDVVSHELRGPVSAILQNADMSRSSFQNILALLNKLKGQGKLPSELDGKLFESLQEDIESMDAIHECASAQERIANDILGLAQIQLNKYSICPVEFDLATSLRNIARMFKTESRAKGIELKLVIGSSLARLGPRARVLADPARLTQILVNLLSNAIRFTAKSAVRRVTLAVEVSGMPPDRDAPLIPPTEIEYQIDKRKPVYLFFSVEDTGPGMTQEETQKLFKKFMQASPFTHTTWGGSGLGLWIARNLCELQAGRIEVASTVGEGSIFRCFITARSVDRGLAKDDSRAIPVIEGITAPNASRGEVPRVFLSKNDGDIGTPGDSAPLSGLRILCCEDNQINRTVLKRQLVKEGVREVLLACDGQEGIDMLYARDPGSIDCVLMDIEMPVLDGLAATRQIRLDEKEGRRQGHQRIVALTGNARNAQKDAALAAGVDLVLTKPYKVPELITKIRSEGSAQTATDAATQGSEAGASGRLTYVNTSNSEPEHVTRANSGARVETITSAPETPGTTPSTSSKQADADALDSMHHHGAGETLPPSIQNAENIVERF